MLYREVMRIEREKYPDSPLRMNVNALLVYKETHPEACYHDTEWLPGGTD